MTSVTINDPDILYEDKYLIVCRKAPGVPSQPTPNGAQDLLTMLKTRYNTVYPVHRLDTPTGGVIIYARTSQAAAEFSRLVQDHALFQKTYLAILPSAPNPPAGTMRDLLFHDKHVNKAFVVNSKRKGAKEAVLDYETLVTATDGHTLLRVLLHTGRTHQIRVQCASRGFPLVGDGKYGNREKAPFAALWASRVAFIHPFTKKPVTFEALPDTNPYPWSLFADEIQCCNPHPNE